MKKNILRAVKIVVCVLLVGACTFFTAMRFDHNDIRMQGFYMEEKNSLDVVILGSSDVYTAFAPGQAYRDYNFTSYPYAVESNSIDLFEDELKDILKYQKPKLLVVEVNAALAKKPKGSEQISTDTNVRRITDNMKDLEIKTQIVDEFGDQKNKLSYYIPFIKYHGQLSSAVKSVDYIALKLNGTSPLKGIHTQTFADDLSPVDIPDPEKRKEIKDYAEKEFRSFLEFCKENVPEGTEILFVRFPHAISDKDMLNRYYMGNYIGDIVEEYGFEYMNFEKELDEIGINYKTDFYNDNHLNVNGQEKFTDYFSNVLTEKYGPLGHDMSDSLKKNWEDAARHTENYYNIAKEKMKNNEKVWMGETARDMLQYNN